MKRNVLKLLVLFVAVPMMGVAGDAYVVDPVHSDVSFKIRHLVSKVSGNFTEFEGTITGDPETPEGASVEFVIDAASIDTRNSKRDDHLRGEDFFDVQKFPEITFRSSEIRAVGDNRFEVVGTLTMHGVAKEMTLPVSFMGTVQGHGGTTTAGFSVVVTLNRKDFGIVWNRALDTGSMILGDEVEVEINLEASKA